MNNMKVPFYAKATIIIIGLFAFVNVLYITQDIIVPILGSAIIAIVLSPLVDFLVSKKLNTILSISIVITLACITVIMCVLLLSSQISVFTESFPLLIDKFYAAIDNTTAWVAVNFNISSKNINAFIKDTKGEILNNSRSFIGTTLTSMGSMLFTLLLVPVYVFMILYYKPLILEFIRDVFGESNHHEVNQILTATKKIVQRYLIALLLEAAVIAVLNSLGLLIIGIDYAIILGIIGAVLNAIPYIGGIIATALPIMIAIATKDSLSYALYILIAYIIIQFIDNNYVLPKLVASRVKINALISIVAVIIGGQMWGITGMFLSIPLTAIIKVICDNVQVLKPWGALLGDTLPGIESQHKYDEAGNDLE